MKAKTLSRLLQGVDPEAEVRITICDEKETHDTIYACINHPEGTYPLRELELKVSSFTVTGNTGENMAVYLEGWKEPL